MRISLKKTFNINLTMLEFERICALLGGGYNSELWVHLRVKKHPLNGGPIFRFRFFGLKTPGCYRLLKSGRNSFAASWKRSHDEFKRLGFGPGQEFSLENFAVQDDHIPIDRVSGSMQSAIINFVSNIGFLNGVAITKLMTKSSEKLHTPEQKDMWEPSPSSVRADPAAFSVADPVRISQAGKAQNFDPERHFQQRYPLKANKSKSPMDTCSITIVVDGHTICAREVPKLLALKFATKLEQVYK